MVVGNDKIAPGNGCLADTPHPAVAPARATPAHRLPDALEACVNRSICVHDSTHNCRHGRPAYTFAMRLTDAEQADIAAAARAILPAGSRVSLFGSRLDDSRRGGDVDLWIELAGQPSAADIVRLRGRLTAALYRRWGERRIDMLMTLRDQPDARPIVQEARNRSIELVRA